MRTTTPFRLLLTALAAGLALTACSSSSGGGSGTPGPSSAASSAASASGSASAAASTPAAAVPTASRASARGTAACTGDHLAVSAGQSNGAAGHIGARVVFRNTSGTPCTLYGFPGVAGLDSQGRQQVQAQRVTSGYLGEAKVRTVLLAPGGTASALVGGVDVPSGNATSCPSYPALLVTPPGTRTSSKVALQMPGCPTLVVYPVVAGVPE